MSNICHSEGPNFVSNGFDCCVVNFTRVGTVTDQNHFWFVLEGHGAEIVEVNFSIGICFVSDKIKYLGHVGHRMPVGEVSTMREIHSQNSIARLKEGKIYSDIGWCTREWLYIDVLCTKKFLGAFNSKAFGNINEFTPTIVAFANIAFGVFVSQN